MMSFWVVPDSASAANALLLRRDDVQRQQPRRRRVDRHRRVHRVERDAVHQRRHVATVRHRHTDLADLAARELVVGVVPRLRRQVERYGEPGLALGQVAPVQLIGPGRRGMARVGAHHPRPVALGEAMRHSTTIVHPRGERGARSLTRSGRGACPRHGAVGSCPSDAGHRCAPSGTREGHLLLGGRRGPDRPGARRHRGDAARRARRPSARARCCSRTSTSITPASPVRSCGAGRTCRSTSTSAAHRTWSIRRA